MDVLVTSDLQNSKFKLLRIKKLGRLSRLAVLACESGHKDMHACVLLDC
jgi:hypothetical protein